MSLFPPLLYVNAFFKMNRFARAEMQDVTGFLNGHSYLLLTFFSFMRRAANSHDTDTYFQILSFNRS